MKTELVKPGYKLTDIGLIPKDWQFLKIQSLLDQNFIRGHLDGNHGELYPRSDEFRDHGIPYIGANDFLNGEIDFNRCKFLSEQRAKQFKKGVACDGDVLFAHNATVGPVALLKTDLEFVILSTTATYFRCNNEKLNNKFLQYSLQTNYFVRQYRAVMSQSTRFQVPITTQRKFSLLLPPFPEQCIIATALSDVSDMITSLDKIITKKKYIKQGAMQELLTGKRRISGKKSGYKQTEIGTIPEDWQVKTIIQFGEVKRGAGSQYIKYVASNGIRLIRINDFFEDNPVFVLATKEIMRFTINEQDILFAGTGASAGASYIPKKEWVGVPHSYNAPRIRLDKGQSKEFLLYSLQSSYIARQMKEMFVGAAQPFLDLVTISNLKIATPPTREEQYIIATILSDIDTEIEKLQKKKEKYIMIKNGMMQKLLTGEIRLK